MEQAERMLTIARKILSEKDLDDALVLVSVIEVYLQVDTVAAEKIQKIEEVLGLYRLVKDDLDEKLEVCFAKRLLDCSIMLEREGRIDESIQTHQEFLNYVVNIQDEEASENLCKEAQTRAKAILALKIQRSKSTEDSQSTLTSVMEKSSAQENYTSFV